MKYLHSWHFWHDQPCLYRRPHVICNNKPLVRDSFNYKSLHFLHVLKRVAQWRCCVVCRWSLLCHLWPGNQQVLFNTEYIWYILLFVSHWPRFLLQNKESTHQATLWFLAIWYIVRPLHANQSTQQPWRVTICAILVYKHKSKIYWNMSIIVCFVMQFI